MRRRNTLSKRRALYEILEARRMLSVSTIRVASYNIEADINGVTTPRSGLYQVLEGIGEEKVQGDVQPIDILGLEETTSNSVTIAPIVSALNTYYNGTAVYAQSSYQATEEGGDTADGNGPNGLIYNTLTLNLLASVGVGTPEGSGNGEYRQPVRYEFQPVGDTGTTGIFYMYVDHYKSGSSSSDVQSRGEEATIIRNDEATLPANSSVLYTGDLNSNPPEQMFTNLTASGQGEAYDPANWSTSLAYYSDSDTSLTYRDDYQLQTSNVFNDTGNLNYVSGSYQVFANNGTVSKSGSVNSAGNTALNSDLVQDGTPFISESTIYSDMTTASDHYPVVADYTDVSNILSSTTTAVTSSNGWTNYGQPVTFTATIAPASSGETGTVQFKVDGNNVGSPVTVSNNVATYTTTSPLSVGGHGVTAVYSGDSSFSGSTSPAFTQNVAQATTTTTLVNNGSSTSNATQALSFTATVTGGVPDGETVTLEDASNNDAVVTSGTTGGGSVSFTVPAGALLAGTHNLIAVYGGDINFSDSQSSTVAQNVQVVVTAVQVNGNIPSLAGVQRSMVDSIVYTFSEAVNISGASAFTIALNSSYNKGTLPTLTWTALSANLDGSSTQWAVTFGGGSVIGNSIANGVYDITMNASAVTSGANPSVTSQTRATDTFWRLYGDYTGAGTVNASDYDYFLDTYELKSTQTGYLFAFDYSGTDAKVTASDYDYFLDDLGLKFKNIAAIATI